MFAWILKNPLLSGVSVVAALAVITLGIQSWRLDNALEREAVYKIRIDQYKASLKNVIETSARREAAIIDSVNEERSRNEELTKKIEAISEDSDEPLPDIIGNAIDRL